MDLASGFGSASLQVLGLEVMIVLLDTGLSYPPGWAFCDLPCSLNLSAPCLPVFPQSLSTVSSRVPSIFERHVFPCPLNL